MNLYWLVLIGMICLIYSYNIVENLSDEINAILDCVYQLELPYELYYDEDAQLLLLPINNSISDDMMQLAATCAQNVTEMNVAIGGDRLSYNDPDIGHYIRFSHRHLQYLFENYNYIYSNSNASMRMMGRPRICGLDKYI